MSVNDPSIKVKFESEERFGRGGMLALSYQGLLTGVVRIRAGRQHVTDADAFRRRTKAALEEVMREATKLGYDGSDVWETHFAVVAFLDSAILNSTESIRPEWERKTLQEELFGQTDAGIVFFEKLERLRSRRDTTQLADVLEVFLLCLLLGFEGRYSGALRGELYSITDRLKARISEIRGRSRQFSPEGLPPEAVVPPALPVPHSPLPYRLVMLAVILATLLLYVAAKLNLLWTINQINGKFS